MIKQKLSPINRKRKINYNNLEILKKFISNHNRILPRYINNVTEQQQRKLSKAIKKARILSLILTTTHNEYI
jgi:small subunit ribosomal protein S18